MTKLSIANLPVQGKKILMRVDFNVPLDKAGNITDDTRIVAALPSILYVLDHGGSLILMSHLGRPKGKKSNEFSLSPCATRLSEILKRPVQLAPDCVGNETEKLISNLKPGDVVLLENLRFYPAEEHPEKDPAFAKQLATLGDAYVNDAFGAAHREHASISELPKFFPGKAAAGFLLEKEITTLGRVLFNPERPFYAIIGGAKISTKIGVIKTLLQKVDALLIGGGMAYTFFKAKGISIGNSIFEPECLDQAREILNSEAGRSRLILPLDTVVVDQVAEGANAFVVEAGKAIPDGYQGVDIGPETIKKFIAQLRGARTVLWNGPLGVFELKQFSKGTEEVAIAISQLNATTIVGGGDSIAALQKAGLAEKVTHLSTGGGASLEYIEFGSLPGTEALSDV